MTTVGVRHYLFAAGGLVLKRDQLKSHVFNKNKTLIRQHLYAVNNVIKNT